MKNKSPKRLLEHFLKTLHLDEVAPGVRRIIVAVIGGTVLLIGIVLIVLPGPAFIVIPLGLGILATEFIWARRWLRKAREIFKKAREMAANNGGSKSK